MTPLRCHQEGVRRKKALSGHCNTTDRGLKLLGPPTQPLGTEIWVPREQMLGFRLSTVTITETPSDYSLPRLT